jgi:hypothetical protein
MRSPRLASVAFLLTVVIGALLPLALRATVLEEPNYLVVTSGVGELLGSHKLAVFGEEYRFKENYRGLHPYLLGVKGKDGASYFGAGILYNFAISPRWRLTASSGPGYYDRTRGPKDLGSTIEFYSNLEVSTKVWHGNRLGLSFGHISNGGLSNHNPGSETLRITYAVPFR